MGIAIDVPGLDTIIPEIGNGRVVVVEGGADLTNSFFVRKLALTAVRTGRPLTFVTSRDQSDLRELFAGAADLPSGPPSAVRVVEKDSIDGLEEFAPEDGLLVVDSFSFLTLELPAHRLAGLLRRLHAACRERFSIAVLATDRGMFDPRAEAVTIHLSDGFLQFHAREGPEGVVRFLRIPKWTDGKFVDRNIYYDFDGKRIAVDLRSRVI